MNLKQSIEEIIKQPDYEPMSVSDFQDALVLIVPTRLEI